MTPAPLTREQVAQKEQSLRITFIIFLLLTGLFSAMTMRGHIGALVVGIAVLGLLVYLTNQVRLVANHPWRRARR